MIKKPNNNLEEGDISPEEIQQAIKREAKRVRNESLECEDCIKLGLLCKHHYGLLKQLGVL
jgi:hypothetical protein